MPDISIAILYFASVPRDTRVLRQVEYLSNYYSVYVIGYGNSLPYSAARMISLAPESGHQRNTLKEKLAWRIQSGRILALPDRLKNFILFTLGRIVSKKFYDIWYWDNQEHQHAYRALLNVSPRIIHANKWRSLPVAARVAKELGAKLILDIPEYAPREMEHDPVWCRTFQPMVDYFLRKYGAQADQIITEAQASAEAYAKEYSLNAMVVSCAPNFDSTVNFIPTSPNRVELIHHGGAMRDRQLEGMIRTISFADHRFTLHFMLVGDESYIAELQALAKQVAEGRVFFHNPVSPSEIVRRIAEYDVGFFILPPINFQWQVSLPNKFFDFINAGLAVCIGPSPEMARLTRQYGVGVVALSFEPEQVAAVLNRLTADEIDAMKKKSLEARKELNADIEMGKVVALYKQLLREA